MFDDFLFEGETETDGGFGFGQYRVSLSIVRWPNEEPVLLTVWAADIEAAMDCGEVLSAVYFGS